MQRLALSALLLTQAPVFAQSSFDNDRFLSGFGAPAGILTEGFPGPPVLAIPAAAMGLGALDEIDALSYGDDVSIQNIHTLVFSPDFMSAGVPGTGVAFETSTDTAPGTPPAAAGDLFLQEATFAPGNILAPPGFGYDAGTLSGDESNATWVSPCAPGAACIDLDAFDHGDPLLAVGVYFSLKPGSPSLALIPASPGDILYSDLSGALPIVATLAGAGPATGANLGIGGLDLDALNVVGSVGPVAAGGGVIAAGPVGPSTAGVFVGPSTHLLQYSVGIGTGMDADVLVRVGFGAAAPHTPSLALGLPPGDNLNALEAIPPFGACPPSVATVFPYNGLGINRDLLDASKVVIGAPWTATLSPQPGRGPGPWILLLRTAASAGPVIDLGLLFFLPPAGLSELLVGGGVIANFTPAAHAGSGTSVSFSALVPMNCALLGSSWHSQAMVFGDLPAGAGLLDPWFSSAMGGTIGTF